MCRARRYMAGADKPDQTWEQCRISACLCFLTRSAAIFFKKYTTSLRDIMPDRLKQCPNLCIGNNGLRICKVGWEERALTRAHFSDRVERKLLRHDTLFTITSLWGIGQFVFTAFLRSSARCSPRQAFLRSQSMFLSKKEAPAAAVIAEKPSGGALGNWKQS